MPQPVRDPALQAYLDADYDACVEFLKGRRGADRDLLLSRAFLAMHRNSEAEAVLSESAAEGRPLWYTFLGAAKGRQGDVAGAGALVESALTAAKTPDEAGAARYQQALLLWQQGRLDEAEALLETADFADRAYVAESLKALIVMERGDYADAMRRYAYAATLAREDVMTRCNNYWNAALLAREMYDPAVMDTVLRGAAQIRWTPYLREHRFQITRNAAWLNAIEGDFAQAMQKIYETASFEVSPAWRTYALCDRAYLSLVLGEHVNGWAAAEEALDWAETIDWESCGSSAHTALLYLAGILASRHPDAARRCRERYAVVQPTDALDSMWTREPHARAMECFTDGLLAAGAGNRAEAASDFTRAFSIYQRIGYRWRAVLTLLALRDVGVTRPGYDDYIAATLQRFPNSWLRDLAERELRKSLPLVAAA